MTRENQKTVTSHEQAMKLFHDIEQQACGVSALGDLLRAANPDRVDECVPYGIGVLLELIASKMFETMEKGISVCHPPPSVSEPT